jgi:hypothetical protein
MEGAVVTEAPRAWARRSRPRLFDSRGTRSGRGNGGNRRLIGVGGPGGRGLGLAGRNGRMNERDARHDSPPAPELHRTCRLAHGPAAGKRLDSRRSFQVTATHIVEAGEHLGSIARKFGFENFSVLWEHPKNAAVKALRKEPTLLAPGDKIFIPDRVRLVFSRQTDASHDFRVHLDTLKLSLRLLEHDGEPRKNVPVIMRVEVPETGEASSSNEQELSTDADGNLSLEIATHADTGTIEIDGVEFPMRIGGLDPIDTEGGVAQRLSNLGYLVLDAEELDADDLRLAIEDFQSDNHLKVTGERADIEAKLEQVHGG